MEDQRPRFSHPFDRFLWLESKQIDTLANELMAEIQASQPDRERAMRKDAVEKTTFFVKVLLLNFLLLHKMPRKGVLALPLGAKDYTAEGRYTQRFLSFRTLKTAFDGVLKLGYIQIVTKGFWDAEKQAGQVTRIAALPKLTQRFDDLFPQRVIFFTRHPNEETIFQKDEKKKFIEYRDTAYSNQARENLKSINAYLNRHWYDLALTNDQFVELFEVIEHKRREEALQGNWERNRPNDDAHAAPVDFTSRSLYRVFNNGSAKDRKLNFQQGGRFYGGWWEQIPSDYRRYITIDQKHTVELDYSNLHPHMLYAMEGLHLKGDAYEVSGIPRDYAKKAFNQLLNGTGRVKTPDGFNKAGFGLTWKQVLDKVKERHALIARYFGTGYGLTLQRKDADILEKVLLHFAGMGYPCLPIHDSIIVHYALKDELQAAMLKAYHDVMGQVIPLKEDDNYLFFVDRNYGEGEVDIDIVSILQSIKHSDYESRWHAWSEQHDQ